MDTTLIAFTLVGGVLTVLMAMRLDFVKSYRYIQRTLDNFRGWEWCYLIEHRAHSHAGDMRYAVDPRANPHLAPDPHYEFYNKPVKVPVPVFRKFKAVRAARKTVDRPEITYEELTGFRVNISDDGWISYESVRR